MTDRQQLRRLPQLTLRAGLAGTLFPSLLLLGCCSNLEPQGHRIKTASPGAPPELALPHPTKPAPVPAERVLNILFTTNGDGDLEPCG